MRAATKTVVELFGGTDGKTRGFFIVKRAAGRIIGARFFKRDAFIYHVHNIDAVQKLLDELLWNHNRQYKATIKKDAKSVLFIFEKS